MPTPSHPRTPPPARCRAVSLLAAVPTTFAATNKPTTTYRICSGGRLTPNDLRLPSDLLMEASAADVARTAAVAALAAAATAIFGGGSAAATAAAAAGGRLQVQEDCNISGGVWGFEGGLGSRVKGLGCHLFLGVTLCNTCVGHK